MVKFIRESDENKMIIQKEDKKLTLDDLRLKN